MQILDIQLEQGAYMPTQGKEGDAAWDLYAPENGLVYPEGMLILSLNLRMAIPNGYCGIITHRSSLNLKGIVVYGLVDSGYRGIVRVNILNTGHDAFRFRKGDRIAQIRFCPVPEFVLRETKSMSLETARGEGGFGSTDG